MHEKALLATPLNMTWSYPGSSKITQKQIYADAEWNINNLCCNLKVLRASVPSVCISDYFYLKSIVPRGT